MMPTIAPPSSYHLANQRDKICIRTELNYCGIYYYPLTMGVGGYPDPSTLATSIAVGYSGTSCTTDYLTIPNGLGVNPAPSTAYTSNQVPFETSITEHNHMICELIRKYLIVYAKI